MNCTAIAALVCLLAASTLCAGENPLQIELVSEAASIQPGHSFYVGLHLQHPRGYHTYWKVPGVVGVPTGIRWELPPGFKAGDIEWPAPERVLMFSIKAQGFDGECLLPIRITAPAELPPDQPVKLKGRATWMCCGQECNPGFQDLQITLPVAASDPATNPAWAGLFAKSRSDVAVPLQGWHAEATRDGGKITLHLTPSTDTAREHLAAIHSGDFFTQDGATDANKLEDFRKDADGVTFTLGVSDYAPEPFPKFLTGIIESPQGWSASGPHAMNLRVPLDK